MAMFFSKCINLALICINACETTAFLSALPSAIKSSCFSMCARTVGNASSSSMEAYARHKVIPNSVGTTLLPSRATISQYLRASMVLMCVGMEASVPMPFFSIVPMSSDSVRYFGGCVSPRSTVTETTSTSLDLLFLLSLSDN